MIQRFRSTALAARLVFVFLAIAVLGIGAQAADQPLRSGTVVSKMDADVFTLIKAADATGKEFWVLTSICTIGENGRIEVLAGAHYDKMQTKQQGVVEDVYVGERVRIGDMEVTGFGPHNLPDGCIVMH